MDFFSIGTTRSGLTINLRMDPEALIQLPDVFDAMAIFEAYAVRELGRRGKTEEFIDAQDRAAKLHGVLTSGDQLEKQMQSLGLTTYADRLRFGFRLLNLEYRDL